MIFIYHSKNFRDSSAFGLGQIYTKNDALRNFDNDGYEYIGLMHTDSLDDAYQMTNHIDCPWTDICNGEVAVENPRSSSVGDIFVHVPSAEMVDAGNSGRAVIYAVGRVGFEKLRECADHYPVEADRHENGYDIGMAQGGDAYVDFMYGDSPDW